MEQLIDIWAERRGEVAVLVGKLQPEEALEILQCVVAECESINHLAPVLIGTIRGVVERKETG
jgi:hypothetical protein